MDVKAYARQAVWDYLLVAVCGVTLSYVVLNGFNADPGLQYGPVPAVAGALLAFALFAVGASRRFVVPGGAAYGAVVVAGAVAAALASPAPLGSDEPGNYLIFALVVSLVPTAAYLLSRRRGGTFALLVAGIFTCGWNQFFYGQDNLACSFGFLFAALALVVYRNYQGAARSARSARSVSFAAGFGMAAAVVAVAVGVGALAWYGIIAPLDPGAIQVKLITEYRALETVRAHGTSTEYLTPNLDLTSSDTNDEYRTTDDLQVAEDGIPTAARPLESSAPADEEESAGTFLGIDVDSLQEMFDFEANPQNLNLLVLLLLLVPLAIAAYFIGRRVLRTRRLNRIRALGPTEQVRALYLFCADRLARVGFAVPEGATLLEFAESSRQAMARFDEEAGASFTDITRAYVGVVYGKDDATEQDADRCAAYYRAFWKAARKQLGNVKYLLKSFRL